MFFGATTFAEDCYGSEGVPLTAVQATGIALALNQTDVVTVGDANVSLTGSAMAFSINEVIITASADVPTTAPGLLTLSVGVANGIAWATVSNGTTQTWTTSSTGTTQTWVPVDEVEKVA